MDTTPGATAVDPDTTALPLAELEERVVGLAGRLASAMCEWLLLLAEFDAREGWGASAGIRSTVHWLSWRCGIAGATAAEQVRVARCLAGAPVLTAAFAAGRLSYSQVRAISRGLSILPEEELVDLTLHVDLDTLNALAHASDPATSAATDPATTAADAETETGTQRAWESSAEDTTADTELELDGASDSSAGGAAAAAAGTVPVLAWCEFAGGIPAHVSTVARLLCDADIRLIAELVSGEGVDLGRARRVPNRRLRRAVLHRDCHRCAFPGCGSTVGIHLHHARHWIHGGSTNADNLVVLCGNHHRMIHEGSFAIGPATIGPIVNDPATSGPAVGGPAADEPADDEPAPDKPAPCAPATWRFFTPAGHEIPDRPPMSSPVGESVTSGEAYEAAAHAARQINLAEGRGYPVNWSYATDCILSALKHRADQDTAAEAAA